MPARVRGLGWPVWLPRGPRVSSNPERSRSRGLPLLDSVSLSAPWLMRACLSCQRQGLAGLAGFLSGLGAGWVIRRSARSNCCWWSSTAVTAGALRVAVSSSRLCLLPSTRIPVRASWLKRANSPPFAPLSCQLARVSLPLAICHARPCLPDVSRYASSALASPLASVALT
ncbi:hypothetical protein D3C78_1135060 [compost metagenome]